MKIEKKGKLNKIENWTKLTNGCDARLKISAALVRSKISAALVRSKSSAALVNKVPFGKNLDIIKLYNHEHT